MRARVHAAAVWLAMLAAGATPRRHSPVRAGQRAPAAHRGRLRQRAPHRARGPPVPPAVATSARAISPRRPHGCRRGGWPPPMRCGRSPAGRSRPCRCTASCSRSPTGARWRRCSPRWRTTARVVLAQPLQEFHTLTDASAGRRCRTTIRCTSLQTNLVTLGIARAHKRTQGEGVRVALIDTGGRPRAPGSRRAHRRQPLLRVRPAAGPAWLRHGTAMAGVIAAVANNHLGIVGIAPLARLEVFEACWQLAADTGRRRLQYLHAGAGAAGALASGAPIVNLSLAGPRTRCWRRWCRRA